MSIPGLYIQTFKPVSLRQNFSEHSLCSGAMLLVCTGCISRGGKSKNRVFTDFPSFFDHRRLFPGTPVRSFWNASAPRDSSRTTALLDPTWSLELNNTLFHLNFVMTRSSGKLFSYFEPISSSAKMVKIFNLSSVEED